MLMDIAKNLIMDKMGDSVNTENIEDGLSSLLGDNGSGDLDVSSLLSNLNASDGISTLVSSWLGDGENSPMDIDTITSLFDNEKLSGFASALGIDTSAATSLLSNIVPEIVDKASSGGNLLDNIGADDIMGFAKKFF